LLKTDTERKSSGVKENGATGLVGKPEGKRQIRRQRWENSTVDRRTLLKWIVGN
jgi:hypothetical protein